MFPRVKKKHIEIFLQDIPDFEALESDKWKFEQHLTPPYLAAEVLHRLNQIEDIENSRVCDLGCGTGMLISGLLFLGATYAMGVEKDKKYLQKTHSTLIEKFEEKDIHYDLIELNIKDWKSDRLKNFFDIVVMNPPFGTKEAGIDYLFLQKAFEICNGNVYSFHKSSTREFLEKKAQENNKKFEVVSSINYPVNKRFAKYHKFDSIDVEVDFICFSNPSYSKNK